MIFVKSRLFLLFDQSFEACNSAFNLVFSNDWVLKLLFLLIFTYLLIVTLWFVLRRFFHLWKKRQVSTFEIMLIGLFSWMMLIAICVIIYITLYSGWNMLFGYWLNNLLTFALAVVISGIFFSILKVNRYEFQLDDMWCFLKEAMRFRRAEQRRIDLIQVMKKREGVRKIGEITREDVSKAKLEVELKREKEIETQLRLLSKGEKVDITNVWRINTSARGEQSMFTKVNEAIIEPNYRYLSLFMDFQELNENALRDEMFIIKFNRELYEFLQSLRYAGWLKRYASFFDNYLLICRAIKYDKQGSEFYYPFMRLKVSIMKLKELEGKYFNPRRFSELGELMFKNGRQLDL